MVGTVEVRLSYGRDGLIIHPPAHATVITPRKRPGIPGEAAEVARAIRDPMDGTRLEDLARRADRVVVVHPDVTRPMPNRTVLPVLLEALRAYGVPDERVTLLCATGTHRVSSAEERMELLGPEIVDCYRTVDHDVNNSRHVRVGEVDEVPICLDEVYVDSDLRIVTGFVEPHFFAGFSGGPKAVCPGVASLETILEAHAPRRIASPQATYGNLYGNPVHDFVRAAVALCPPQFSIDVTMNTDREITGVFAGSLVRSHASAVALVRDEVECKVPFYYDVVVTTNSGYPLDQNFYQCGKGLAAAERIVKPGGDIIMAAECSDGVPAGSRLDLELAKANTVADLARADGPGYLDRWAGQILGRVLSRARVSMYSGGLSDDQLRRGFVEPVGEVDNAIRQALERHGAGARLAVLPYGPLTIAGVAGERETGEG